MACTTVTIQPEKKEAIISSDADFEQSRDFYFWGLYGEHTIDVTEICGDRGVEQMQTQATFKDSACTFITFGIYTPHTVKVWCQG